VSAKGLQGPLENIPCPLRGNGKTQGSDRPDSPKRKNVGGEGEQKKKRKGMKRKYP